MLNDEEFFASSAEFVGSPKACAHISNGNKVPYSFVRRRILQYPLRSDAYTRCPEPPPEAPFPIAHTSRHRGAQPRVKAGAAAELAREALRLGEHRGLLKRRWKTVLPTNSAEDPDFLTHLEKLAEDVVGDPHPRRVVTSEN